MLFGAAVKRLLAKLFGNLLNDVVDSRDVSNVLFIDIEDLCADFIADVDFLCDIIYSARCNLGNVDESIQSWFQFYESTVFFNLDNLTLNDCSLKSLEMIESEDTPLTSSTCALVHGWL